MTAKWDGYIGSISDCIFFVDAYPGETCASIAGFCTLGLDEFVLSLLALTALLYINLNTATQCSFELLEQILNGRDIRHSLAPG